MFRRHDLAISGDHTNFAKSAISQYSPLLGLTRRYQTKTSTASDLQNPPFFRRPHQSSCIICHSIYHKAILRKVLCVSQPPREASIWRSMKTTHRVLIGIRLIHASTLHKQSRYQATTWPGKKLCFLNQGSFRSWSVSNQMIPRS